jgi:hypothetical protein
MDCSTAANAGLGHRHMRKPWQALWVAARGRKGRRSSVTLGQVLAFADEQDGHETAWGRDNEDILRGHAGRPRKQNTKTAMSAAGVARCSSGRRLGRRA